ncbi:MAG: hypothetical protein KAY22_01560 [Rhizorhabdus sp.]|uniref:hypothetical protein n=1 Tax=Rhizorhabdus sp. TaxID=1968843 RepID=UPI001B7A206C|nr:hypothetical protein [Rhizorhabdus sp.]MBP8230970.1 hypothetical protein [Rhizorhabdus sp.]
MKLYKFTEQTGSRVALAAEQNPDLPAGAWRAAGTIEINRGDGPRIGAGSDEIMDGIDREGVFVWPVQDGD